MIPSYGLSYYIINLLLSVHAHFNFSSMVPEDAVKQGALMVTTEISQVPLSGVLQLIKMAKYDFYNFHF